MATSKTTQYRHLKLTAGFSDEDDRTITLLNPKTNLTASQINAVGELAANVLIGDKHAAPFTRFKEAKYIDGVNVTFDFT